MAEHTDETPQEIEDRARAMGWRPESEWDDAKAEREGRRRPPKFLSAADYLDRAETNLPVLNERLRKTTDKMQSFERELDEERKASREAAKKLDEMHQIMSDQQRLGKDAIKRAREQGKREAEDAAQEAVINGDAKAHTEAQKRLGDIHQQELEDAKAEAAAIAVEKEKGKAATAEEGKGKASPAINRWVADNSWFQSDPVLKSLMVEKHSQVLREFPGMDEMEQLDEAADRVRNEMPHRFGGRREIDDDPPPARTAAVSRPSSFMRNGRDTPEARFDRLPKDDRDAYERMRVRFKVDRKVDYTKSEYMKDYEL